MSAYSLPTLAENVYMEVVKVPGTITTGTLPASYIDVSQFEWFAFMMILGATDGTHDMQVVQATAAAGTSSKVITGAAITQLSGTDDNKYAIVQVRTDRLDGANGFKFVSQTATIGGTTSACILFFGWRGDTVPVSQPANFVEKVVLA